MIVLDTNVLSEMMKPRPDAAVERWFSRQQGRSLFLNSISETEVLYGLARLPRGTRRDSLEREARAAFDVDFAARVLPFGSNAAPEYAVIAASRQATGRPISHADGQIAAIARRFGACIATRNVKDFTGCGVEIVNPWEQ